MSNCFLIILVIGSCVTFCGFPCRFWKCCFHSFIRSCWFVAFSLALAVLFLLFTSFIVCYAILDCLSSTESLILSIWFCMYYICSFRYMLANSFCVFFSFRAFALVGFFLLHLEAVFTSARFFLTANVSHGTLGVAQENLRLRFGRYCIPKGTTKSFLAVSLVFLSLRLEPNKEEESRAPRTLAAQASRNCCIFMLLRRDFHRA